MGNDDVLFKHRLRLFSLAEELGNVRAACRAMDVHPSTYYRWKRQVEHAGLEMLRPRERRAPRMPNQTSPGHRAAHPRLRHRSSGPRTTTHQREPRPGALGRHRPQRQRRLARAAPPRPDAGGQSAQRSWPAMPHRRPGGRRPEPERHIEVDHPGELVGIDCFHVGRLAGTQGRVWQYTAIDLATSFTWAELHATPLNPSARYTERPGPARGGRARGTPLAARAGALGQRLASSVRPTSTTRSRELGATHTFIRPGRPQSNGSVERVQRTILEECWRPSFARSLVGSHPCAVPGGASRHHRPGACTHQSGDGGESRSDRWGRGGRGRMQP